MEPIVRALASRVGLEPREVEQAFKKRVLRRLGYRGVEYVSFRKDYRGVPEGSIFLYEPSSGESMLVEGFPPIRRVALLSAAVPKWFVDRVVVEEKLDGYNVRVVFFAGRLLAVTRGGLVCPYTTARMNRVYGGGLREFFGEYDPGEHYVAGEVVGLENPYTRYFYPESPRFGFYAFEVFRRGKPVPVYERREMLEKYGIPVVPVLGEFDKSDVGGIREVVRVLEEKGREGVVLKDPFHRVPPLKYTTSSANIGDLEIGMRFLFEEGRSFLFSRILREVFKSYEEGVDEYRLREKALRLGLSILAPAIESVKQVASGGMVYEEFQLEFADRRELEEFTEYMEALGVDLIVARVYERSGLLVAVMRKPRETWIQVRKILETGLSPLD